MSSTKSVRLTNSIRDKIVSAAIAAWGEPLRNDVDRAMVAAARALYDAVVPPDDRAALVGIANRIRARLATVSRDPSVSTIGLGSISNRVRVYHPEHRCGGHDLPLGEYLPQPDWGRFTFGYGMPDGASPLVDAARAALTAQRRLRDERDERRAALVLALAGCRTLADLERDWPDGEEYYAFVRPSAPPAALPAVVDAFARFRRPQAV